MKSGATSSGLKLIVAPHATYHQEPRAAFGVV